MDYVSVKVDNHIGIVTINKPPVNSFNRQLYNELEETFRSIGKMDEVWVVILRAEGKDFSTGNDVKDFLSLDTTDSAVAYARSVSDCAVSIYECPVPVIGAIHGKALGSGLVMASCCDILIAAENAFFSLPEIKVGIVGGAGFLSRLLPQQLTRYLSYSGDMMTAEQLKHYGALLKVVPENRLLETAMGIAQQLTKNSPLTLRAFKKAMNHNENARLKEKYAVEISSGMELMSIEDFQEAISAFFEKRMPKFKEK